MTTTYYAKTKGGVRTISIARQNSNSKYRNKKITVNGLAFDSVKEARRYGELVLLQRAGEISDLRRQVKYTLIPRQTDENGKILEREVGYVADFTYIENSSNLSVVEDVKGIRTKEYVIKRKLMLWVHGIRVREV